jgi:putative hydrolase of the HAD superfamily
MSGDPLPELLHGTTALILDMCGTFMFGHDHFGPDQAYGETYRLLGGTALSNQNVCRAIAACFSRMNAIYLDAARHNSFPSVLATLLVLPETIGCSESELSLLEEVFAKHEVGRVPEDYADTLQSLAKRYRLALVTNTWSRKSEYVAELKRAEVFTLFDVLVFSSDGCTVKPSPDLFQRAVVGLGVEKSETLVIGDSLRCDIGGALAAGLRSIWIDPTNLGPPSIGPQPHAWIRSLRELVFHYRC